MLRMLDLIWQLLKYSLLLTIVRLISSAFGLEFGVSRQYLRLLEWLLKQGQERIEKVESKLRVHSDSELSDQNDQIGPSTSTTISRSNGYSNSNSSHMPAANGRPQSLNLKEQQEDELGEDERNGATETAARQVAEAGVEDELRKGLIANKFSEKRDIKRKVSILNGHFEFKYLQQQETATYGSATDSSRLLSNGKSPSTTTASTIKHESMMYDSQQQHQHRRQNQHQGQQQQKRRRVSTPDGPPVFLLDDSDDDDANGCESGIVGDHASSSQYNKHEFHLEDASRFVVKGAAAIIDDEVTKRFTPEELKTWNLLTRTNAKNYQFMSRSLGLCWLLGLLIRYAILMPLRIMFTLAGSLWLICSMTLLGLVPKGWRDRPYRLLTLMSFRMLSCGITSRLRFHNSQYRANKGDICVANHTSPIDVVLLACDNCYALVGQRHGGLLGLLEIALSRAANHVWFDRSEMRDRQLVTKRLKEHISNRSNLPVLIFPEGTCINNSAVMMFRKGSFETTDRICPVAIKYDPRFGDPFWNSSKQSYLQYLLMMMSSWAIKCDVWYLPPMERYPNESSAEFANRVKAEIARQGGLVDLAWDGQLKRSSVKPAWLYQQQEDYVKRLKLE